MGYTPISTPVYLRAFAGCVGGLGGRSGQAIHPGDNAGLVLSAAAFAQELDQTWAVQGDGAPTEFALRLIEHSASAIWAGRSPLESVRAVLPESYAGMAAGIVAAVVAADEQLAASGISPSDIGGNVGASTFEVLPTTPTLTTLTTLVPGDHIVRVNVIVTEPFDGAPSLRVRANGLTFLNFGDATLTEGGQYMNVEELEVEVPDALMLDFSRGGATVGEAYVTYMIGRG